MRTLTLALTLAFLTTALAGAAARRHKGGPATDPVQMNRHFTQARADFQKKSYKAAARDIRAGEAIVRREASKATGKEQDDLIASAGDLRQLADDVDGGKVESVDRLNSEFARADNRLAEHYRKLAAENWERKQTAKTGSALATATSYFESATTWTGEKAEDVVHGARTVSGKLVKGAGWVPKEVGDAISDLGNGIQRLGQKIKPGSS